MNESPTPEQIYEIRQKFGWTQSEAAALVWVTLRGWQWWESGKRKMPIGLWELLLIKADLHPNFKWNRRPQQAKDAKIRSS
jgi:DNA-binding transcriptional regulator YiaG